MTATVHDAREAASPGVGAAPLSSGGGRKEQAVGRSRLGSGIESLLSLFMWGGRAKQPDELEEVNEGGSEQLAAMTSNGKSGTGYTGVDDGPVWHQAASAVWHPAAGAPSAAAPAPSPRPSIHPSIPLATSMRLTMITPEGPRARLLIRTRPRLPPRGGVLLPPPACGSLPPLRWGLGDSQTRSSCYHQGQG